MNPTYFLIGAIVGSLLVMLINRIGRVKPDQTTLSDLVQSPRTSYDDDFDVLLHNSVVAEKRAEIMSKPYDPYKMEADPELQFRKRPDHAERMNDLLSSEARKDGAM